MKKSDAGPSNSTEEGSFMLQATINLHLLLTFVQWISNVLAKYVIGTITQCACIIKLQALAKWPEVVKEDMWTFAICHGAHFHNASIWINEDISLSIYIRPLPYSSIVHTWFQDIWLTHLCAVERIVWWVLPWLKVCTGNSCTTGLCIHSAKIVFLHSLHHQTLQKIKKLFFSMAVWLYCNSFTHKPYHSESFGGQQYT